LRVLLNISTIDKNIVNIKNITIIHISLQSVKKDAVKITHKKEYKDKSIYANVEFSLKTKYDIIT
jgi:hypothetical protein